MEASGSVLTNKYAEGYPARRYYGGCEFVDMAESIAIERAKKLFGATHANVQPHSGTQANMAAYASLVQPGDTVMGMRLDQGGHLSHGSPVNFSGKQYNVVAYGVERESELIDFAEVEALAKQHRPKVIVAGYTAYSRTVDFPRFRAIADEVGATLMVDMAHIAGLVAGGAHPSPLPHAHVVTSTTHKTLRGPRGALILSTAELSRDVDRAVFPQTQGGPFMHVIAAKAICFGEALQPEFAQYAQRVVDNTRTLAETLSQGGLRIVSGGTDNHLFIVDLTPMDLTGKDAEDSLGWVNIHVTRNAIPYDPKPPRVTSGLRIGTAALTSPGHGPRGDGAHRQRYPPHPSQPQGQRHRARGARRGCGPRLQVHRARHHRGHGLPHGLSTTVPRPHAPRPRGLDAPASRHRRPTRLLAVQRPRAIMAFALL